MQCWLGYSYQASNDCVKVNYEEDSIKTIFLILKIWLTAHGQFALPLPNTILLALGKIFFNLPTPYRLIVTQWQQVSNHII